MRVVTRDTEKCLLSILTGVCIKRVNFRQNYEFFVGTHKTVRNVRVSISKWVSVEQGSTVKYMYDKDDVITL